MNAPIQMKDSRSTWLPLEIKGLPSRAVAELKKARQQAVEITTSAHCFGPAPTEPTDHAYVLVLESVVCKLAADLLRVQHNLDVLADQLGLDDDDYTDTLSDLRF